MKLKPIITSLLDTDFYKFTMGNCIYHQFSTYETKWAFKCRNKDVHFTQEMVDEIKDQLVAYSTLRFKEAELAYLSSIRWLKKSYIDYLRLWHPNINEITVTSDGDKGLTIEAEGSWLNTSMYEIPILAIVNEVYFRFQYADKYDELVAEGEKRIDNKIHMLSTLDYNIGTFSEFGTRRRFNKELQRQLIMKLINAQDEEMLAVSKFVGTSNVELAQELDITAVGTMAHEFIMCVGQGNPKHNPAFSNWYAMESWVKEYGVLNGIYLTDAIGDECCRKDMQLTYSTLFKGVRHDSGDPYRWGEEWIKHYESLGINPKDKTLLFSDSLDFERATKLNLHFRDRINVAFGIGTWLANDVGVEPLNIVMKVIECNGRPVAKLSNDFGKCMCQSPEYIEYLKRTIDWRMNEHIS